MGNPGPIELYATKRGQKDLVHSASWGRSRSVGQTLCFVHLTIWPPFSWVRPSLSFPIPFRGETERKINSQTPGFSAVFLSQLPCISKTLPLPLSPTASHRQPNIEYGKQEKQQHYKVTSFDREHYFGYIFPHTAWIAKPCSRWPYTSLFLGDAVSPCLFLGFKNAMWERTSARQGDWAIHVSTSEYLSLTFFENIFCLQSLVMLTCSLSSFFPVWAEWGEGGKGEGWPGWRLCFHIPSVVGCFLTAIWMPAGCIWDCSMGRRVNASFRRLQNSVSAWHSPGFYLVNRYGRSGSTSDLLSASYLHHLLWVSV